MGSFPWRLLGTDGKFGDVFEHDADEGDEMKVCQGLSTAFVVFDEFSEAGGPREGSFDDPSSGQQHETALVAVF